MLKKQYKIILFFGLAIITLFFVFSHTAETNEIPTSSISFTVMAGDTTFPLVANSGQSLYDVLLAAKEDKQITFSGKNYSGLGFFITDINSLHSGDGKDLIFYINGKEANVGVSSYVINNGDVILWKLE